MQINKKEISFAIVLIIIAFVRYLFFTNEPLPYDGAVNADVTVRGSVVDIIDRRTESTRLVVAPQGEESNILVVINEVVDVEYGDMVDINGVLTKPENFMTETGREFNYERYLANKDVYFIIKNAKINIISSDNGNYLKSKLFKIREIFLREINTIFTHPESDLASGLLLGSKGDFDKETKQEFITTGTIHIIALSGYNVTIVAQAFMRLLGLFLSTTLSIVFGIVIIILFVILSGGTATAVRAGVMACIALFARITGRAYDAGRGLVIAGLLMVAYDLRVVYDISFQLSFIATFGLIFITPKIIKYLSFLPLRFQIRENAATTIACTVAVMPILLYSTGVLSIVSIFANILILSFIPYTMLFAFLGILVSFFSGLFAMPFVYVAHLLLSYILQVIHFFASLSFASTIVAPFHIVFVVISYVVMLYFVFKKN